MRIASLAVLAFVFPVTAQEGWLTNFEEAKAAAKKDAT